MLLEEWLHLLALRQLRGDDLVKLLVAELCAQVPDHLVQVVFERPHLGVAQVLEPFVACAGRTAVRQRAFEQSQVAELKIQRRFCVMG